MSYGFCFGRPPFVPLSRAAATFASEVDLPPTRPPLRPSATAAGFLRGIGDALHTIERRQPSACRLKALHKEAGLVERSGDVLVAAVLQGEGRASWNRPEPLDGMGHWRRAIEEVATGRSVRHTPIIPNRFGFVKWAEMGGIS